MKPTNKIIGANLRRIRKKYGVTQADLGAFLGLHQTAIHRIETGFQQLSANELYAVSRYFKVRMIAFFEE